MMNFGFEYQPSSNDHDLNYDRSWSDNNHGDLQYNESVSRDKGRKSTPLNAFYQNQNRSIFVRDLPFHTTGPLLKDFIEKALDKPGCVDEAVIRFSHQGKSLQVACVLMQSDALIPLALEKLHGCRFYGRDMRVTVYNNKAPIEDSQNAAVQFSFLANETQIPLVTEEVVRSHMEEVYGPLRDVCIRFHRYSETGIQSGYGFMTFINQSDNEHAVDEVQKKVIHSLQYDCRWSSKCKPVSAPGTLRNKRLAHLAAATPTYGPDSLAALQQQQQQSGQQQRHNKPSDYSVGSSQNLSTASSPYVPAHHHNNHRNQPQNLNKQYQESTSHYGYDYAGDYGTRGDYFAEEHHHGVSGFRGNSQQSQFSPTYQGLNPAGQNHPYHRQPSNSGSSSNHNNSNYYPSGSDANKNNIHNVYQQQYREAHRQQPVLRSNIPNTAFEMYQHLHQPRYDQPQLQASRRASGASTAPLPATRGRSVDLPPHPYDVHPSLDLSSAAAIGADLSLDRSNNSSSSLLFPAQGGYVDRYGATASSSMGSSNYHRYAAGNNSYSGSSTAAAGYNHSRTSANSSNNIASQTYRAGHASNTNLSLPSNGSFYSNYDNDSMNYSTHDDFEFFPGSESTSSRLRINSNNTTTSISSLLLPPHPQQHQQQPSAASGLGSAGHSHRSSATYTTTANNNNNNYYYNNNSNNFYEDSFSLESSSLTSSSHPLPVRSVSDSILSFGSSTIQLHSNNNNNNNNNNIPLNKNHIFSNHHDHKFHLQQKEGEDAHFLASHLSTSSRTISPATTMFGLSPLTHATTSTTTAHLTTTSGNGNGMLLPSSVSAASTVSASSAASSSALFVASSEQSSHFLTHIMTNNNKNNTIPNANHNNSHHSSLHNSQHGSHSSSHTNNSSSTTSTTTSTTSNLLSLLSAGNTTMMNNPNTHSAFIMHNTNSISGKNPTTNDKERDSLSGTHSQLWASFNADMMQSLLAVSADSDLLPPPPPNTTTTTTTTTTTYNASSAANYTNSNTHVVDEDNAMKALPPPPGLTTGFSSFSSLDTTDDVLDHGHGHD